MSIEIYKSFYNNYFKTQSDDEILDYVYYDIALNAFDNEDFYIYRKYLTFVNDVRKILHVENPKELYNLIMTDIHHDYDKTRNKRQSIYTFWWRYSFAVPNNHAIHYLSNFLKNKKCIEVGAGRALWAHLLYLYGGIETKCYDDFSWFQNNQNLNSFYLVKHSKYAEIPFNNADVLMLIWPPPHATMAYFSLIQFSGKYLIFIGELHKKSQTGCKKFHEELQTNWILSKMIKIPRFTEFRDFVCIFTRR